MPWQTWCSEGAVLATGVNLGLSYLTYVRAVRLQEQARRDPVLAPMRRRIDRSVAVGQGVLVLLLVCMILVLRMHAAQLGWLPHPFH